MRKRICVATVDAVRGTSNEFVTTSIDIIIGPQYEATTVGFKRLDNLRTSFHRDERIRLSEAFDIPPTVFDMDKEVGKFTTFEEDRCGGDILGLEGRGAIEFMVDR